MCTSRWDTNTSSRTQVFCRRAGVKPGAAGSHRAYLAGSQGNGPSNSRKVCAGSLGIGEWKSISHGTETDEHNHRPCAGMADARFALEGNNPGPNKRKKRKKACVKNKPGNPVR